MSRSESQGFESLWAPVTTYYRDLAVQWLRFHLPMNWLLGWGTEVPKAEGCSQKLKTNSRLAGLN